MLNTRRMTAADRRQAVQQAISRLNAKEAKTLEEHVERLRADVAQLREDRCFEAAEEKQRELEIEERALKALLQRAA